MSFTKKTVTLSCVGLLLSAGAAFAQVGGSDIPSAAKAKGGMMHGSSMMKHHSNRSMMRGGAMKHHTMMRSSKGRMAGHKTF